jgi:hypothetical protein
MKFACLSADPSAQTAGNNPIVLYALRMMHENPHLLTAINGAMAEGMQSEAGTDGMPSLPPASTTPRPARLQAFTQQPPQPTEWHLSLGSPSPFGQTSQMPIELSKAIPFQIDATWAATYASKCDALSKVTQALYSYSSYCSLQAAADTDDEEERMRAIFKRTLSAVEGDTFLRALKFQRPPPGE